MGSQINGGGLCVCVCVCVGGGVGRRREGVAEPLPSLIM